MKLLHTFVHYVFIATASAAVAVAVPAEDGSLLVERPALTDRDVVDAAHKIFSELHDGIRDFAKHIARAKLPEPAAAAVADVFTEDKTVTAPPAGTTTVIVTGTAPMVTPDAIEPDAVLSTAASELAIPNLPHELIMTQTSAGDIVITTAVVQETVVTTVTAVGYSGGTSWTILSGGPSENATTTATSPLSVNATSMAATSCSNSTTITSSSSMNVASILSSQLSKYTASGSRSGITKPMVTLTSTSTRQLPGPASSTLQLGSSSGSESNAGDVFLPTPAGVVACFMLAFLL